MNGADTGALIRRLRREQGMTQLELAQMLHVSDKTVSKWETGRGLPDVGLLPELATLFRTDAATLLHGSLLPNDPSGGNMKKAKYYVCPVCGSITLCSGNAEISCCGRKLEPLEAKKATAEQKLTLEQVEDQWYISSSMPMRKEDYISFVAFASGAGVNLVRQYPEWDLSLRLPMAHGTLLWYSDREGLLYQLL